MKLACFTVAAIYASFLSSALVNAADAPATTATPASAKTVAQPAAKPPLHRHPTLVSMLRRSNGIRRGVGLRPQRINPALTKAAQDHANYMAATGDFQHYSNGGPQSRAGKYGFKGFVLENIAFNFRTVDDAFNVWHGSGGHYASIVSNTTEAGFGYAIAPSGATYWVGVYGNPAKGDVTGEEEGHAEKVAAEEKANAEAETKNDVQKASAEEEIKPEPAASTPKPAGI